jgi:hypothetical protein
MHVGIEVFSANKKCRNKTGDIFLIIRILYGCVLSFDVGIGLTDKYMFMSELQAGRL